MSEWIFNERACNVEKSYLVGWNERMRQICEVQVLRYRQLPNGSKTRYHGVPAFQESSKYPQHQSTTDVQNVFKRPPQHHSDRFVDE